MVMLLNYFNGLFPKKQYINKDGDYLFFSDGEFDTSVNVFCANTIEDIETAQDKVNNLVSTYGYSESYDLFDAVISMEELLKYMDNAIDNPERPECEEDIVPKERIVKLLHKMEGMCDKLRNELDVCE